ncbi:MAG TPA: DUF1236 domain-containing protein [Devosia sp.]|jgi:hypothetical protein
MKKILLASVAAISLAAALPVMAQDTVVGVEQSSDADEGALVGGAGGAAVGASVGAVVGGPIGAIIGGFAGATLGASAGVQASSVEYAMARPVEPIYFTDSVDVGYVVPADVNIYPIEGDADFGYVYANDRVWIVDLESRTFVQSPGYLVPQTSADYVISNPIDPVELEGDVVVGYVVPESVELVRVPDSSYSYVYVGDRPALVDTNTRVIVQIN